METRSIVKREGKFCDGGHFLKTYGGRLCLNGIFIWLLTACLIGPAAGLTRAGVNISTMGDTPDRTVIRYELGDFHQQEVRVGNQIYSTLALAGESNKKIVGAPALPDVCRSIIVGDDARMAVRVLDSSYYEIEDIDIAPSKGYISRKVNPADVPYTFGPVYETDDFYPGATAELGMPYIMRDHRGVVVTVNPFQYNPVRRVLRVYTDLTIEVSSAGSGGLNVLRRRPVMSSRAFRDLYRSHFINYGLTGESRYTQLDEEGEMLIIVHDDWNTNVQPLKTHKDSIGIETTIVNVSTIGNDATSIKNYIQNVYDTNDLAFVLLVGDAAQVATPSASGGASDPSYSLLAGSDNYPDIIVGRFSAQTAADVDTQVERTVEYESGSAWQQTWFWKGTGIASDDVGSDPDDGELDWEHIRNIRTDLLDYGYVQVDELYEGSQGGDDAAGDPTAAMVSSSLNAGRGIVNYCGHGTATTWSTTGFSNSDIDALINDNILPFIFSVACNNGEFDNYSSCFAEAWMRATNGTEPSGAVGIYASSISQSWAPPMEAQDEFNLLYTDDLTRPYTYFGSHCYAGSCSMMDDYPSGSGSGVDMFNTWHIFGDPSLRIVDADVNTPPFAFDSAIVTDINVPVTIALNAADEGQPDPPGALTYIIMSLPSHGDLNEPGVGMITDPCTALANYGNEVEYIPNTGYEGPDSFTFKANDGGSDPNGGDSNIGTVSIDIQPPPMVIYEADFESGLGDWSIDNDYGNGGGLWHLTTVCSSALSGHTVPTSLYYGQDVSCNYDAGVVTTEGVVTSGVISLAEVRAPIELSFHYYLETEVFAGYDIATVEISQDGGAFTEVAANGGGGLSDPSDGWEAKTIDLSALEGSDIRIRFGFNTVDTAFNAYPGFYVDDVNIMGVVGEPNCELPPEPNNPTPPDDANTVELAPLLQWDAGRGVSGIREEPSSKWRVDDDFLWQIEDDEPNPLPRYATPEEEQILRQRREQITGPIEVLPRIAPTGEVWTPGEYEQLSGVLVRWGSFNSVLTELIVGMSDPANESTAYVIVTDAGQQDSCSSILETAGADMNNVEFLTYTTDSVWICDYGPRYFYRDMDLTIMDHNYNRPRPNDDAFPSWLSTYWGQSAYELDELVLEHGGGNFHVVSDGNGFMSSQVLDDNPGYSEGDVVQMFADYHNVNLTIYDKLPSDVDSTGHIDMWLLPLSDTDILVSEFSEGSAGYTPTETAAADLESRGYTVWRTPAWVIEDTHYTYTNAVIVNDKVFIPEYGDVNDGTALSIFEQAMSGYEIIQVDCSSTISLGGALHCITKPVYLSDLTMWDVYLGAEPGELELVCQNLTEPMCEPGFLEPCTPYSWQVVAKNSCGEVTGEVWSFKTCLRGDFELDGDVDAGDLAVLVEQWLQLPGTPSADIAPVPYGDSAIDFLDLSEFAYNWLKVCD